MNLWYTQGMARLTVELLRNGVAVHILKLELVIEKVFIICLSGSYFFKSLDHKLVDCFHGGFGLCSFVMDSHHSNGDCVVSSEIMFFTGWDCYCNCEELDFTIKLS